MPKQFIYTLIIFAICISAASCVASQQSNTSIITSNSPEKNSDAQKDREADQSEKPSEDKETAEKEQLKSDDQQKDTPLDSPEKATKSGFEMRCGWYSNPTPGNHWLEDKDGEWIIGVQGGHQAEGDYPPEFGTSQWIATNGYYGYGCACLSVKVDKKKSLVLEVASAKARPLSACQNDPALKELRDK